MYARVRVCETQIMKKKNGNGDQNKIRKKRKEEWRREENRMGKKTRVKMKV